MSEVKNICGKPVLFTKTFKNNGETFSGISAAKKFLEEKGFSVGSMQRSSPMGVMKGDILISKWRNLDAEDILQLDGAITFGMDSPRDGDAVLHLNVEVE